jgi:hypothetical protein
MQPDLTRAQASLLLAARDFVRGVADRNREVAAAPPGGHVSVITAILARPDFVTFLVKWSWQQRNADRKRLLRAEITGFAREAIHRFLRR